MNSVVCADCKRDYDAFDDFHVETAIWNYVFAGREQTTYTVRQGHSDNKMRPRAEGVPGILCYACFAARAIALGIDYRSYLREGDVPNLVSYGRPRWEQFEQRCNVTDDKEWRCIHDVEGCVQTHSGIPASRRRFDQSALEVLT